MFPQEPGGTLLIAFAGKDAFQVLPMFVLLLVAGFLPWTTRLEATVKSHSLNLLFFFTPDKRDVGYSYKIREVSWQLGIW